MSSAVVCGGVLLYDPENFGGIRETRQYVFIEWDPTATSDMGALASYFDSNGDGVLDASDAEFANFKVMVTNADGSTTAKTLAELDITSINLTDGTMTDGHRPSPTALAQWVAATTLINRRAGLYIC